MKLVPVYCTDASLESHARSIAAQFGLTYVEQCDQSPALQLTHSALQLNSKGMKPLIVDFVAGKAQYRRAHGGGTGQLIAKACGIKANFKPTVLDVTAGLGRDAFVLASLGASVSMVERNPVIAALLQDGLNRLYAHPVLSTGIKLTLIHADAWQILQSLSANEYPHIIYLDPMHPKRNKSSLVKKEMQILQDLIGSDQDKQQLFANSLHYAQKRVVLKWPRLAAPISEIKPDVVFMGKSTKFEVYFTVK